MNTSDNAVLTTTDTDPLGDFSHCHTGIVARLDALGPLPALVEAAARARRIAHDCLKFFDEAVESHHEDEERELIPAVRASASRGAEKDRVDALARRLVDEHRALETLWGRIRPQLKRIANGRDEALDGETVARLVADYKDHARFEETEFLPLAAEILGRSSRDLAALGLSIHIRHTRNDIPPYI